MTEAICFDVYGSTHDQHSTPVRRIEAVTGVAEPVAECVSELWATEQLRYSFEVTMMDRYETWWTLADWALEYALDNYGLAVAKPGREEILDAYRHLEPYEDWTPFERLASEFDLYILSDGNPEMLETLAENTDFDQYLSGIMSAHDVGVYKPRPEVYRQMRDHLTGDLSDCQLVATHHFDVAGAINAGLQGTFLNRFGEPTNRLGVEPTHTVNSYSDLAGLLLKDAR